VLLTSGEQNVKNGILADFLQFLQIIPQQKLSTEI